MRNIKLTVEYDGTLFNGWQIQDKKRRTVQGELEKACKKIFKKQIRVIGSGRTDSGVHASAQVANFQVNTEMATEEILRALNANLPEDIAILKVEDAPKDFHSQFSARRKTYRYTILCRRARCAQLRHFCLFYPHRLNVNKIKAETKFLLGKRNFKSFQAADSALLPEEKNKDTVRTILNISISKKKDFIAIDIEANGFLYKMARNIVGTLLEVGSGRLPQGSVKTILKKRNRSFAPATAPAHGLCLIKIDY